MAATRVEVEIGGKIIAIESGEIARQAGGSVMVYCGESIVFGAATSAASPKEGQDWFPLSMDYREKFYASGKIPGSFARREARPSEREILTSRLADRPIRPLFPDGFMNDTQVFTYALSYDGINECDVLSILASSASLFVSNVPFHGPVGAVRMGYIDGVLVVNPTAEERKKSLMDIVVAGTDDSITMVEGESKEISEELLIQALEVAHTAIHKLCAAQKELAAKVGRPKMAFTAADRDNEWHEKIRSHRADIKAVICIKDKHARIEAMAAVKKTIIETYITPENKATAGKIIKGAYDDVEQQVLREMILNEGLRADGRTLTEVRPITIRTGVLPRAHGSALFTRGETQVVVAITLGTGQDEQLIDNIEGKSHKNYMYHYNFPPFSVGETKGAPGPGRREIGHGALAERALQWTLPDAKEFPYTLRIVSEVMESNGSSSMASVCGGSLALMDGGVKIKAPIAGVAMGLVAEGDKFAILTDILGIEDALGDMDFKVAGSRKGITAIQMDIKLTGIKIEIMKQALMQALKGRLHILDQMEAAMPNVAPDISKYAPRMIIMKVPNDMIGAIIGPGGKNIRAITEATKTQIDIEDDGSVKIFAANSIDAEKAKSFIETIIEPATIGKLYFGKVTRIVDFGAFVEIAPGTEGLVHISHCSDKRINSVSEVMAEGDQIWVKVIDVDPRTRKIRLSHKEAVADRGEQPKR